MRHRKLAQPEILERRLPAAEVGGSVVPDFSYLDENPNSLTSGLPVSPRQFLGQSSAWYFAHAGCSYCAQQFERLDALQNELSAQYPLLAFNITGVNEAGFEAGDPPPIVANRDLAWVQDEDEDGDGNSDVWEAWDVAFRDLVILGEQNQPVAVYNLTTHNLADPANYQTLRAMLVDAAMEAQVPYQNSDNAFDVNADSAVTPLDALLIINDLNENGARELPPPTTTEIGTQLDVNGDGMSTPLDALLVIQELNALYGANPT